MAIRINSELIKNEFKKKGIIAANVSRTLGYGSNTIAVCLSRSEMREEMIDKLSLLLNLKKEDIILPQDTSKNVHVQKSPKTETDRIVSYICDIGKIQTDILRELKELHDDMNKFMQAINTNIIDTTAELHQTAEAVRNHGVATNQNMNKIHNLMKYGGK